MPKTVELLDWLVELDIQHYKTESHPDYTPSGKSHFYLKGSPERFTSEEIISIYNNNTDKDLNQRWCYAVADALRYKQRHS